MARRDDPHARRDREKLALHLLIADRLRENPEIVLRAARGNLARWQANGEPQPYYQEWERILGQRTVSELVALITADNEEGQRLRQSSPFVGVVTAAERESIFGRDGVSESEEESTGDQERKE